MNILAFVPALILGVVGGLLGALFTFANLKVARGRKWLLGSIKNSLARNLLKLAEPVIIMVRILCFKFCYCMLSANKHCSYKTFLSPKTALNSSILCSVRVVIFFIAQTRINRYESFSVAPARYL